MNTEPVWIEYRAAIKTFLHSKVSSPDDVDDLLQEVLIKTHNNLHTIESERSIKSWLFQVANRTVIDFYRKRAGENELTSNELWPSEQEPDVQLSLSRCIEPFINALPHDAAKLLIAIELQGQTQKAYADEHGISYSTLKSQVQKSRRQLRGLFEDCCRFTLDHRGSVIDFEPKSKTCKNC